MWGRRYRGVLALACAAAGLVACGGSKTARPTPSDPAADASRAELRRAEALYQEGVVLREELAALRKEIVGLRGEFQESQRVAIRRQDLAPLQEELRQIRAPLQRIDREAERRRREALEADLTGLETTLQRLDRPVLPGLPPESLGEARASGRGAAAAPWEPPAPGALAPPPASLPVAPPPLTPPPAVPAPPTSLPVAPPPLTPPPLAPLPPAPRTDEQAEPEVESTPAATPSSAVPGGGQPSLIIGRSAVPTKTEPGGAAPRLPGVTPPEISAPRPLAPRATARTAPPGEGRGSRVLRLSSVEAEQETRVTVEANGPLSHQAFMLSGPPRLVVDFEEADYGLDPDAVLLGGRLVERIRSSRRTSPTAVRVVFDLRQLVPYWIESQPRGVIVHIGTSRPTH